MSVLFADADDIGTICNTDISKNREKVSAGNEHACKENNSARFGTAIANFVDANPQITIDGKSLVFSGHSTIKDKLIYSVTLGGMHPQKPVR